MKASFEPYILKFKNPSGTSRGVLTEKLTYLFTIEEDGKEYVGECGLFKGLSVDDRPEYEEKLQWVCDHIELGIDDLWNQLREWPSIQFGIEQAFQAMQFNRYNDNYTDKLNPDLYESAFRTGDAGIKTNGLIWMGSVDFMREQIQEKLAKGFKCIKIKIGVDWENEHKILQQLRAEFSPEQLELRVDANGGFTFEEAKVVLQQLADLKIHSIEQPIKAGQVELMTILCATTPTPIALDEELIGVINQEDKFNLLEKIKPQYIILKPSLVGGIRGSLEWINAADTYEIDFWITSALESNIGLSAIAQWTAILYPEMPQGLGTGGLFTNNFPSRLELRGENLFRNKL
ncbi:o-succinylbenzoate synthase [Algoriella xinjiangensis]|uniref:O-succinylbenzoate synthase n=1 Tax=Algoriella xinjiangensis TaxID=684065 RepID=A0A1I4YWP6_9FLAO|nr:o-succinylbenzoate synthase [Algoriella xinjiangensis]SFN42486.1 o-succinylbenzoate synthase [Algoriella xinjiangensis]VDH16656.1 L-Ala-D/L-Glu epimerase [Algoriella xinjiangensis]